MDSYWGGGDAASAAADSSGHLCECGGAFGAPEADGFSYCPTCGSQSQDVFHAVADEDDLHAAAGEAALYSIRLKRKCSQPDTTNIKFEQTQTDSVSVSVSEPEARDFGGAVKCVGKGELVDGIRRRYVEGLQVMLQRQCEALVERFGVSPIIGGFVGTIWLRFVDASGVFDDGWPERVVAESEAAFAAALDNPDYSKDLSSYLKYCKEIVFAGRIHSPEEEKLMERLRNISEKQEGNSKKEDDEKFDMKQEILTDEVCTSSSLDTKELRGGSQDSRHMDDKKIPNGSGFVSKTDYPDRDVAIENMKLNMEENGFQYLSPRSRPRNTGYLHYRRKRADGELNFVAHADYYILLRTCASLAQVDVRVMHLGILKLERRLEWTDQQIDISLH